MYVTLIKAYGYKKENIFVHYANGNSVYGRDLDGPEFNSIDIDYNCNISTIQKTFDNLSGIDNDNEDSAIPELTKSNQLFVYMTGTGNFNSVDRPFFQCNDGERIYIDVFATYCENIKSAQLYFFPDIGLGDKFRNDFMDYTNYDVSCKNRVFISANGDNFFQSWPIPETRITQGKYGEFLYYWTAAIRGYYPNPMAPWDEIHPTGDFPFNAFFDQEEEHPDDYNPDDINKGGNGDGFIQMEEAFNYANNFDSYSSFGFNLGYDEDIPVFDIDCGMNSQVFTMNGLNGVIDEFTVLSRDYLVGDKLSIDYGSLALTNSSALYIPENGNIEFSNTNFNLYSGSKLIVDGTITVKANRYLKIYGYGNTILNGNINSDSGSSFYLYGSDKTNKMLEVQKNIVFDTDFSNIIIKNGKIIMNGTSSELYFNSGIDNITIDNVLVTSSSGSNNGHEGVDIRSNGNITIKNSTFENGYYGIYTSRSSSAPNINLNNNIIQYCTYGARFNNSGVNIDGCDFKYNSSRGLYCYSMDKLMEVLYFN